MNTEIRYEVQVPSSEEYNRLRKDVAWPEMEMETAARCLPHSLYVVCAYDGDELTGMGRIVGDGGLCFFIQDLIVARTHHRRGIGTAIMERLMGFIADRAVADTYVGLMSAVGKEPFYHRFGFTSRPTESLGCGMTRFWEVEQDPPGFEQDGRIAEVPCPLRPDPNPRMWHCSQNSPTSSSTSLPTGPTVGILWRSSCRRTAYRPGRCRQSPES